MRSIERLLRRSLLPIAMSEGFHPKMRMSFPSALALGVAGNDEVIELDLTEPIAAQKVIEILNQASCAGLTFLSAKEVAAGRKKSAIAASVFEMTIPENLVDSTKKKISAFLAENSVNAVKHNGKTVDVRAATEELAIIDGQTLRMKLTATRGSDAGFREVLDVLGLKEYLFREIFPARVKVLLANDETPKKKL